MESQNKAILAHLKSGNPISPLYALKRFGCMRLASRIADIKGMGYTIKTEMVRHNKKRFALYHLTK